MYCPSCGKEAAEGSMYCPSCGTALGSTGYTGVQGRETGPQGDGGAVPPPPVPPPPGIPGGTVPPPPGMPYQNVLRNNSMCIAALVLGIASLVFVFGPMFGTLLGIAGIILGKIGMDQVDERPDIYTGRNMGQVGFVLSIIGVALNVLFTAARFMFWGFHVFW
ncbi:MAG: DUF4190 domain-containing protein [Actinobacteria bacterium]|nr:DUF4190 domain-containing protein [Actinomycetota bacterium]